MAGGAISYRQLLRLPNMVALLSATCLGRLADRMFATAIVFHALAAFKSPDIAGWIAFAAVAPGLLISPLAGALLDRAGAIRAILADLSLSTVVALIFAVSVWTYSATPAVAMILAVVYAMTSPLSAAGIRVLLPRLVPPDALDRANALDTAAHAVVDVTGPSLAGLLVGFAGPIPAFSAIAAVYAAATACVALIRGAAQVASPSERFLRQALQGLRFVVGRPVLRGLAMGYSLNMVTWGVLWVSLPVSLARTLPGGTWEPVAGLLWAGVGLASGMGALIAGQLGMAGREVRTMPLCMIMTALGAAGAGIGSGAPGIASGLLLAGLVASPIDVAVLTLRQRRTDPGHLGRVLAVSMSLNMAGFPIGAVLGGWLAAWSPQAAYLVAALASGLGALAIATLIPADDEPASG